jgi:hypothetical protein
MSAPRDLDRRIQSFLAEGPMELPDASYDEVRHRMEHKRQRAVIGSWRTVLMTKTMQYGLVAAAAVVVAIIGFGTLTAGPTPGGSPSAEPSASATTPSSAVDERLTDFLQARIAGEGAEEYLYVSRDSWPSVPPLLYATTSGAPYERAEFEPGSGIEWPYGLTAFVVRLFAGDTVVEQLFFSGPGDPLLRYYPDGFGTEIAPTTENGQPVAMRYSYFDGEVTLYAAHPWTNFGTFNPLGLIPEGPGVPPTTDGAQRHDGWGNFDLMPDPAWVGTDCRKGPDPADAEALAESIRSDPGLEATAPVTVRVGGGEALMMEVRIAAGAPLCVPATDGGDLDRDVGLLHQVFDLDAPGVHDPSARTWTGVATGRWMRFYLVDVSEGLSMRILAIAIIAPESSFERAVEAAAPVIDSVEFNVP